jgi:branched-chain amino acid transport system permease protein
MGIGGLAASMLQSSLGVPLGLALLGGGVVAALAGMLIGLAFGKLGGFLFSVVTLAMGELIRVVVTNSSALGGALGFKDAGGLISPAWSVCLLLLVLGGFWRFEISMARRTLVIVRESELLAASLGLNVLSLRTLCLAAGSFVVGLAGGLYIHTVGILDPRLFGFEKSVEIMMYAVLGGARNFGGAVISGILLTTILEFLRVSSELRMVLYGISMVIVVVLRPEGIMGRGRLLGRVG